MGRKQTQETKDKIAEALRKPGSEDDKKKSRPKSKIARKLFTQYQTSKQETLRMRAERDRLRDVKRSLPRGKKSRPQRKKLKAQIDVIRAKMRVEVQNRKRIRTEAKQAKRVIRAKIRIQKAHARLQKSRKMEQRAKAMIAKVKKAKRPNMAQRLKKINERLKRIEKLRAKQKAIIEISKETIASKGIRKQKKIPSVFDFHELKEFNPTRALTTQEERVQFSELNEQFNKIESQLEDDLIEITAPEIDRFVKSSEAKIDNKDLAAIALMAVLIKQKTKDAVSDAIKKSYNIGKSGASEEMDVPRSPTPLLQTQIQNAEIEGLATTYTEELERSAKSIMVDALAVGAATAAIVSKVRERMTDLASRMIMNMSGSTVGQYVNRGRKQVFTENINKITKFQRSEILDSKTCFMCMTLDGRIVKADDPISQMDLVHTNCRGIWVPIFVVEKQPKINPIPKTATKNFDFVDGRPLINAFKQLKRPINKANATVQRELRKRLT